MNGKGKEILSAEFKTYSIKYIKVLQNIKILFLENLHRIFIKCQELIPNLSFSEFFDIVRYANHLNIWGYTAIDIEYIPYIFNILGIKLIICVFYIIHTFSFTASSNIFPISTHLSLQTPSPIFCKYFLNILL